MVSLKGKKGPQLFSFTALCPPMWTNPIALLTLKCKNMVEPCYFFFPTTLWDATAPEIIPCDVWQVVPPAECDPCKWIELICNHSATTSNAHGFGTVVQDFKGLKQAAKRSKASSLPVKGSLKVIQYEWATASVSPMYHTYADAMEHACLCAACLGRPLHLNGLPYTWKMHKRSALLCYYAFWCRQMSAKASTLARCMGVLLKLIGTVVHLQNSCVYLCVEHIPAMWT